MASIEETATTGTPGPTTSEPRARIRFNMEVSPELNDLLDSLVERTNATNKSEVVRNAIALMGAWVEGKERGEKLYLSDTPPEGKSREIIGI